MQLACALSLAVMCAKFRMQPYGSLQNTVQTWIRQALTCATRSIRRLHLDDTTSPRKHTHSSSIISDCTYCTTSRMGCKLPSLQAAARYLGLQPKRMIDIRKHMGRNLPQHHSTAHSTTQHDLDISWEFRDFHCACMGLRCIPYRGFTVP